MLQDARRQPQPRLRLLHHSRYGSTQPHHNGSLTHPRDLDVPHADCSGPRSMTIARNMSILRHISYACYHQYLLTHARRVFCGGVSSLICRPTARPRRTSPPRPGTGHSHSSMTPRFPPYPAASFPTPGSKCFPSFPDAYSGKRGEPVQHHDGTPHGPQHCFKLDSDKNHDQSAH